MKCENYTYLQEQAEESLEECSLATPQLQQSKLNHTAKKFYELGSEMESCQSSLSTETSANLTEHLGGEKSTSLQADSLAKTSVQRVKVQELPAHVQDFGKSMRDLLERFGLNLSLPKTRHCFELGVLELSSKIWPKWGMMQGGECWELGTLVRPTSATECGSWPTPRAKESGDYQYDRGDHSKKRPTLTGAVKTWPTPCRRDYKGTNAPEGLTRKDGKSRLDQLPNAVAYGGTQTQQKWHWPTPVARGVHGLYGGSHHWNKMKQAGHHSMLSGQLNPSWVEWLMGWPIGWTDLKPLETDRFRNVQQWHSEFYPKD
jgi:hypothetical protein